MNSDATRRKPAGRRRDGAPTARRRAREREARRQAMLRAAEAVFAERGFAGATMEEVARRAEFSVGALYNFFPSKEALFAEVVRAIAREFVEAFRAEVARAPSPLEALRAAVRREFQSIREHGSFFRSVIEAQPAATACPEAALPRECRELYDRYIEQLAALFRRAMARRQVRKLDPRYAALALEGVLHAYAAYWHRQGIVLPVAEEAEIVLRNWLDVVALPRGRGSK